MSKLLKSIGLISSVLFSSLTIVFAQEQITITTYYPSPYGSYNSLQVDKIGVGDNNADGLFTAADVPTTSGDVWIKGNVGIGTMTPGAKLEVNYGGASGRLCLGDVGHGVTWPGLANCAQLNTAGYALIQEPSGAYTLINKNNTAGYIGFRVANADKMVINQDGNVGIGTTGPSYPLSFGNTLGAKIGLYDMGSGTGYGFGIQSNLLQIFCNTSGDRVGIGYGYSGSFSETLTVKGGSVGIMNSGPSYALDVTGDIRCSSYIRSSASGIIFAATGQIQTTGGTLTLNAVSGVLSLKVNGVERAQVHGSGLDVGGTVNATGYQAGGTAGVGSATFTTVDGKTVTVKNGLITSVV